MMRFTVNFRERTVGDPSNSISSCEIALRRERMMIADGAGSPMGSAE